MPETVMPKTVIKIVTSNVRWASPADGEHAWERRRSRLLDLWRAQAPDVLGLQEPVFAQLEDIRASLSEYESFAVGREDGGEAGEFCPIFYRSARFTRTDGGTFWFSETPDVPGSRGWGCHHPRICTWVSLQDRAGGGPFFVYNLHWDHQSQQAREESASILLDRIGRRPSPGPVIVLGDFNAEGDESSVQRLSAPDSPAPTSALLTKYPKPAGTFHGFTGKAEGTPIDHIFLSPEWEVLDVALLTGDGQRPFASDHFPLAATLRLR